MVITFNILMLEIFNLNLDELNFIIYKNSAPLSPPISVSDVRGVPCSFIERKNQLKRKKLLKGRRHVLCSLQD